MSMSVVDVYDNVLESHVAEFIEINMKDLKWEYDYHSKKGEPNKHWHIFCGHDDEELTDNSAIKSKRFMISGFTDYRSNV